MKQVYQKYRSCANQGQSQSDPDNHDNQKLIKLVIMINEWWNFIKERLGNEYIKGV